MKKIHVRLFGVTTVLLPDGTTVSDLGGRKPRQVLEMLALSLGTPVSKDRLVEQLWGGNPPRSGSATLESYVSLLRRRLGVAKGRRSALATASNGYLLDPELVEVDVAEFRRLTQAGVERSDLINNADDADNVNNVDPVAEAALTRVQSAMRLVGGELLASEPYTEWAVAERVVFDSELVAACNRGAGSAMAIGRAQVAVELARRAIGCDEMSESSWQLLIRGLSATGARGEALRAYLDLRHTLVEALGAEPSPVSRALYLDLLAEERPESTPVASVNEVKTLLGLLRDALEGFPDVALTPRDRRLTEKAERLVGAA